MSTNQPDTTTQPGDYYGTIYKEPLLLLPLAGLVLVVMGIVLVVRKK